MAPLEAWKAQGLLDGAGGSAEGVASSLSSSEKSGDLLSSAASALGGDDDKGASAAGAPAAVAGSNLGGDLDLRKLSSLTGLTSAFGDLGMDSGMLQKFVPIALKQLGGDNAGLLKKGLGLL